MSQKLTATDLNPDISYDERQQGCRLGIDSHADTSCVNKHAYIEHVEGMTVDAIPFDDSIGETEGLSIVHAIYAIDDDPTTFTTYLIQICNTIYIPCMKQGLLCPNQAQEYGTIIDDVPSMNTLQIQLLRHCGIVHTMTDGTTDCFMKSLDTTRMLKQYQSLKVLLKRPQDLGNE